MHYPVTDIQANFEINRPIRYQNTTKQIIDTDGRTDKRTDKRHIRQQKVFFFRKKKQDAREAMRVVFSVLTKRICMHKTKFLMNTFKYCFKNYIKLHKFVNCNSANYDV